MGGGGCEGECEAVVDIVLGKGDGDVGRFIHKDGGGGVV